MYQWRHWCHDKCRRAEWLKVLAFCNSLSQAKKGDHPHPYMQHIAHPISIHWTFIDPLPIYLHSTSFIWDVTDMMYDTPCCDPIQIGAQAGRRTSMCRMQPSCIDTTSLPALIRLSPHLNIKHSYFSSHIFGTEMIGCPICIHATPICIHAVIRPRRRPVTAAPADSRVFYFLISPIVVGQTDHSAPTDILHQPLL